MEDNKDNRIVFKLGFCCKCGENNTDRFLINYKNENREKGITLLCSVCERLYSIEIQSEEIPLKEENV